MEKNEIILNLFKSYWFHAGQWHHAHCRSIVSKRGFCECFYPKIKKEILENLNNL